MEVDRVRPNLFTYATSELSADAVICWLFAWGNEPSSELYPLVKDLLMDVTNEQFTDEISTLQITRQFHQIDILIEVNDEYIIAIENKMNTREHGNQLTRYPKTIQERFPNIESEKQIYVYWKPTNDSDFYEVREKHYYVLTRERLLALFLPYTHIQNAIFQDYYQFLLEIEKETNSHNQIENLVEWSYRAWQGFYTELQKEKSPFKKCWGDVANPSGGFLAFYWDVQTHIYENQEYYTFWQIEQHRIALKLEVPQKEHQKVLRTQINEKLLPLMAKLRHDKLKIQKTKARIGKYMTVAEIVGFETKKELQQAIQFAESLEFYEFCVVNA